MDKVVWKRRKAAIEGGISGGMERVGSRANGV